jgi:hypothetical protein
MCQVSNLGPSWLSWLYCLYIVVTTYRDKFSVICLSVYSSVHHKTFADYYSKTTGTISSKLYRNDQYQVILCIILAFLCRLYGVVATYRDHFSVVCLSVCPSQNLSGLLLINFWCNFIQTLQEWSVTSLVSIFWFNDFCQSYGPLLIFIFKVCPDYFSYTTNAISMKLYRIDL